jgi:hypothetical protein
MEPHELERHVDSRKLSEVFAEQGPLDDAELEHLKSCEDCLELVRILVGEKLDRENERPDTLSPRETGEHWYVLKVRERFEPVVAATLRQKGIEVLLPEFKRQGLEGKQVLFRSYVVSRFALRNQHAILTVPGVLYIMGFPKPTPFDPKWVAANGRDFTFVPGEQ